MKIATYKAIRPGIQGIGSWAVQKATHSIYSHSEVIFEPGDDVEAWMPDGSLEQGKDGTFWAFGSTASDIMPAWSKRRVGRRGGCRFKRIEFQQNKWDFVDVDTNVVSVVDVIAACKAVEGLAYDWRHIGSFLGPIANFIFRQSGDKYTCAEVIAMAVGLGVPELFHPYLLHVVAERFLAVPVQHERIDNSDLKALLTQATAVAGGHAKNGGAG